MSTYVPLAGVANRCFSPPDDFHFAEGLMWLPIAGSELHLASHHLPLAIRLDFSAPSLGVIVHPGYAVRPCVDAEGTWIAGYRPLALRAYPFQLRPGFKRQHPLEDLEITVSALNDSGAPLRDASGQCHPLVAATHKSLLRLQEGQVGLIPALERLLIADLLAPLRPARHETELTAPPPLFGIDPIRLTKLSGRASAALARHDFTSFDVAIALLFSQRLLRRECLPEIQQQPSTEAAEDAGASQIGRGLEDALASAVDVGTLFDYEAMTVFEGDDE
ncbi:SapC family protein [Methylobacterium sp. V23]|uniref:SapC family protein n=1 Tax=Methylobacterium sp. V23 TaxID=2044878 RepID=UPI0011B0B485|nr:SapC family protein [Methylobacterium sp. V23]